MQCKLGYLWKGKVSCNYFVLVTTQVLQISPVVCDGTITGDRGEYLRPEDLRGLVEDY